MSRPRSLAPDDRKRILRTANEWARAGSFTGVRTRAFVLLALCSGLRLKELCNLNLDQLLDRTERGYRLRSIGYLRTTQSKGRRKGPRQWNSAGAFHLSKQARTALRIYLRAARRRGWLSWPPEPGAAVFVTIKGKHRAGTWHGRLSRRSAQHAWKLLQQRAMVADPYGAHCLRHEALTRFAVAARGDVFRVASYGRCDMRTAQRYVHVAPEQMGEIVEAAQRSKPERRRTG